MRNEYTSERWLAQVLSFGSQLLAGSESQLGAEVIAGVTMTDAFREELTRVVTQLGQSHCAKKDFVRRVRVQAIQLGTKFAKVRATHCCQQR